MQGPGEIFNCVHAMHVPDPYFTHFRRQCFDSLLTPQDFSRMGLLRFAGHGWAQARWPPRAGRRCSRD